MGNQAISIKSLEKRFQHKQVIAPLSLDVPKGQLMGLLGPSGCGKTTLIKMIMGMLKPDRGAIQVLDLNVPHKQLLNDIGYMAQSDALYTDLTGEENLHFFAKLYSLSKAERIERVAYAASLVRLTDDLRLKVENYSGGMKRRLSLAIALIQNPKLLILDEPTVGIDPVLKKEIWQELIRLKDQEQKTILVTTHAMDEAERCDQLAMLRSGHIIAQGTPQELKDHYQAKDFDEVFVKAGGDVQ
ncbi:ABC transporter ATP-binding protein [Lysinibacillus sp. OL1_EC]|uniref:ABC transporter ATP-binding protein n=1 Tax=unclassified Lysinibacillus TaxID=2636778 RepID=UPI00103DB00C|nr:MULTISPECIES: ABC transporter ATP-binding protein [unclassified Lysinibacillus]MCM0623606.1 ABC transporter ATP-binding protein [Lysinibacillus sp. OL1_EC]MCS5500382.1 ABC transporter ATP-binding protein [Lysinibacillus sp. A4]TBV89489.1 ABC transporter ATP-binding protein [Lysinibacillus sp. OL1]UKJ46622.1 ABC transporter ATP-binding protein [Lysinibacillus sp. ACHW1.5]WGT38561.1 ABC transporter ATP-binding protein [Lysinibacillus sp. 1 U-2021]